MRYNLGDKLTINGTVVDEGNQVRPTLGEIISKGKAKMYDAVEAVIAKHEREIKKIEDYAKAEKESALFSISRCGACSTFEHNRRMAGIAQADMFRCSGLAGQSSAQHGSMLSGIG